MSMKTRARGTYFCFPNWVVQSFNFLARTRRRAATSFFNTEARPGGAHFGASTRHGRLLLCFNTEARGVYFALQFRGAGRLLLFFNEEARGLILCFYTEARCAYFCASTRRRRAPTIVFQRGAPCFALHHCSTTIVLQPGAARLFALIWCGGPQAWMVTRLLGAATSDWVVAR